MTDTFLVHLSYFDSLDAVPLSYRLVPGAKLGSGAPVDTVYRPEPNSANVWHEKVDLSGNQVHSLTLTTADGRTARYFVALDYIIENKPFKYQTNALFFKGDSLYAATMDNGLFLSTDHAATFQPISGLGAQRVNCVYARGNTIYAGVTTGLAVSVDAGRSWSTHGFEAPFNGYPYGMVNAVAVQGDSIYAANFDGVYISGDGGGSFNRVAKGTFAKGGPENMSCITVSGNVVYAGMTGGFFERAWYFQGWQEFLQHLAGACRFWRRDRDGCRRQREYLVFWLLWRGHHHGHPPVKAWGKYYFFV